MSDICAFCGQPFEGITCASCGSVKKEDAPKEQHWQQPFLHKGYIIWAVTEDPWCYDVITYHFFLGETLVETIQITRDLMREFVPEGEPFLPFLWKLLEVAQGKKEVGRVEVMNRREPAMFEFRRVPTEREKEIERLTSLPESEMYQEILRR